MLKKLINKKMTKEEQGLEKSAKKLQIKNQCNIKGNLKYKKCSGSCFYKLIEENKQSIKLLENLMLDLNKKIETLEKLKKV